MRRASYTANGITLLLEKCQSMKEVKQTQALLTKTNLIHHPHFLSKLITLSALSPYANLDHALSIFNSTPTQSPSLYNTLIRAYSNSIFPIQSIHLYNQMCLLSIPLNNLTLPFVLKACARISSIELEAPTLQFFQKGAEIHCRIFHVGLDCDIFIRNSLISMYSQCGRVDHARKVFDEMAEKTAVSWNAMVVAYDRHGDFKSADQLLRRMPEKNVASWNSIITRHARSGDVKAAMEVFEAMPERDSISWNSLIAGYIRVKNYKRAIKLFKLMLTDKYKPTELTIVSVLGACAETGSMEIGQEIHSYLKNENIAIDGFVGNALLDMYAKSGNIKLTRQIFDEMGMKHVSCWNTMIVASAVHGHCDEALELFSKMDTKPNRVTFLGVLLACSHKGLVEEGREYFRRMVEEYKIEPDIKHYGCMIDMFSRLGLVDEACKMVKEMPMKANSVIWKTVLGACRVHGDVELAEEAFRELGELEPLSDGDYVLMSNIYAEAERWDDVERLRCGMIGRSISKQPGCSQIELN